MTVETFTSSTTWTAPAGVTTVTVECWGGGGGGGDAEGNPAAGGGGAGGCYALKEVAVTPGNNYTVTVGAGGAADLYGGDSWFSTSTTVRGSGGAPGAAALTNNENGLEGSGYLNAPIGDVTYQGGDGAPGNYISNAGGGAGGGGAGSTGVGGNASNATGGTGTDDFGGDGANGPANNSPGTSATTATGYGGGGGGAKANNAANRSGGSGAPGFVRLTYGTPANSTFFQLF